MLIVFIVNRLFIFKNFLFRKFRECAFYYIIICSLGFITQLQAQIFPYTLKNGIPAEPYDMVGSWSESFEDYHYKPDIYNDLPNSNYMNFRLMFPVGYDSAAVDGVSYPIIVFLHGAGESGRGWNNGYSITDPRYDNNSHQLLHGGKRHRDAVLRDPSHPESFNGFLFYPQTHRSGDWAGDFTSEEQNTKWAFEILQELLLGLKIDPNRIYVHGLSAGGAGTWEIILHHPEYFAAAAPISGSGKPEIHIPVINHIPIWISQGGQDRNPSPGASENMINQLELEKIYFIDAPESTEINYLPKPDTAKNFNRYSFYPTKGHGVWNDTWARRDWFQWLLSKKKNQIRIFGEKNAFCEGENIKIGVTQGFGAYEWKKDGVLISETHNEFFVSESGTYQVRFKNIPSFIGEEWSEWSDPIEINVFPEPVIPIVTLNASTVLNGNAVRINVDGEYNSYQWYYNGNPFSPGDPTDFIRSNAGSYKLTVENNFGCNSEAFELLLINESGGGPATPSATTVTQPELTSLMINWNDNSGNETGFEIHRAMSGGGPWEMIKVVAANEVSYTDTTLDPGGEYFYRIRAINDNGGSGYSNTASNSTLLDINPPTPVNDLWGTVDPENNITLTWEPANDDVGVAFYRIFDPTEPSGTVFYATTQDLFYTITGLEEGTYYDLEIAAVDGSGNQSSKTSVNIQTFGIGNGISYSLYYGSWSNLPDFDALTPVLQGVATNITENSSNVNDNYALKFEGLINITTAGDWTFWTRSDDGSKLYINGVEIVNNDGLHGNQNRAGTVNLTEGLHQIRVTMFERTGGQNLEVRYRPGVWSNGDFGGASSIPDAALFTIRDLQPPTIVSNLSGIATDASVVLSWEPARDNYEVASYKIYNGTALVGTTTELTFKVIDLAPSTEYMLSVRAMDVATNLSDPTPLVISTTQTVSPNAPLNLTGVSTNHDRIQLTWEDNSDNETQFLIERSFEPQDNYVQVATVGKNVTNFLNTGLSSNTTYYYRIRASNINLLNGGHSDYSQIRSIKTIANIPVAPTHLVVDTFNSPLGISLSWNDNSSNENGFYLQKSTSRNDGFQTLEFLDSNITSYLDDDVEIGVRYFYRVRAFNEDGNSVYTPIVEGFIPGPMNLLNVDWKLRAVSAHDNQNNTTLESNLINGEDFMDNLRLNPGYANRRVISVELPTMEEDGMFIYNFHNQSQLNLSPINTLDVNVYLSDNSTNGIDGTWTQLPESYLTVNPGDLQKVNIDKEHSGKWFRVEFINNGSVYINISEFGMYEFQESGNHNYFLVTGASLMENMGSHRDFYASIQNVLPDEAYQPVFFNLAEGGDQSQTLYNKMDGFLEQHPKAAYVLIHVGGNDVTDTRPGQFNNSSMQNLDFYLRGILEKVYKAGKIPILANLTFRDYKDPDLVGQSGYPVDAGYHQEYGSLPYNLVHHRVIKDMTPQFYNFVERKPIVDLYGFILNNQGVISNDGVHLSNYSAFREFWILNAVQYLYKGERESFVPYDQIRIDIDSLAESKVDAAVASRLLEDSWEARIYVEQLSDRFRRLELLDRLDSLEAPIYYYSKPAGDLTSLESWGLNSDGTGATPAAFKFDRQNFILTRNATVSNWDIDHLETKLFVQSGAQVTLDQFSGTLDLDSGASAVISNRLNNPNLEIGNLDANSTVTISGSNHYIFPYGTYGNLIINAPASWVVSTFGINGSYAIQGDLIINGGTVAGNQWRDNEINLNTLYLGGNFIRNGGAFRTGRYTFNLICNGNREQIFMGRGADLTFYGLSIEGNSTVVFKDSLGTTNVTVGVTSGGLSSNRTLSIADSASLSIENNNLTVLASTSVNSNNERGTIQSLGGSIILNSTSPLASNLYFDKLYDTLSILHLGTGQTGSGAINIRSEVNITSDLLIDAGQLNSLGNIRLISNENGTARIGQVSNSASISGEMKIQRYIPADGRRWRYIGAPVAGMTVADLQQYIPVTGTFSGASTGAGMTSNPSMFFYNESVPGISDNGWEAYPKPEQNNQIEMEAGSGYAVFVREDELATIVEFQGAPNLGNTAEGFEIPLSYTDTGVSGNDGWNLISNPFASTIDWNESAGWNNVNINASVYIRYNTSEGGGYKIWNNISEMGDLDFQGKIPPGQAFYVQANAESAEVNIFETAKIDEKTTPFYRTEQSSSYRVELHLEKNNITDKAYLTYNYESTTGFDRKYDARKLKNDFFSLSILTPDKNKLAISSDPLPHCDYEIPLIIENLKNGSYKLKLQEFNNIGYTIKYYLKDNYTGDEVEFNSEAIYTFTVESNESQVEDRFILKVVPNLKPGVISYEKACEKEQIELKIDNGYNDLFYFVSLDGIPLTDTIRGGEMRTLNLDASQINGGKKQMILYRGNGFCGFTEDSRHHIYINQKTQAPILPDTTTCIGDEATINLVNSYNLIYHLYDSPESTSYLAINSGNILTTPVVTKNTTFYYTVSDSTTCKSDPMEISVKVIDVPKPEIGRTGDKLFISNKGSTGYNGEKFNYQWLLNEKPIEGANEEFYIPRGSGFYSVAQQLEGCIKNSEVIKMQFNPREMLDYYPNPVQDVLYLKNHEPLAYPVHLAITDSRGKIIHIKLVQNIHELYIDVQRLNKGLYYLIISDETGSHSVKFIKE